MARMVRKRLYTDDWQEAVLKQQAALTGLTESQLIRDAINAAYDIDHLRERRVKAVEEMIAIVCGTPLWPIQTP